MAAISAFMQIRAGQAEKEMYGAKGAEAKIQGRAKAIEAKQKGVEVLQRLNETLATTAARATTGGGVVNTLALDNYAMKTGSSEYYTTKDNATLAIGQADFQAGIYKIAGKQAMLNAYAGAAGTIASAAQQSAAVS